MPDVCVHEILKISMNKSAVRSNIFPNFFVGLFEVEDSRNKSLLKIEYFVIPIKIVCFCPFSMPPSEEVA